MVNISFIQPDGTKVEVNATEGDSVMKVALDNGVGGIRAECNGSAACATCHVFFAKDVLSDLPPMEEHESDLLDFAATERQEGSRLSCQITISEHLEGQTIGLPEDQ